MNPAKRRTVIAGNWKMNFTPAEATAFINEIKPLVAGKDNCDIIFCAPYVTIAAAQEAAKGSNIKIGAENVHFAEKGAYTGEVSAQMIASTGAKYVIVGHSECRMYHGDTNATVRTKAQNALDNGLIPIICVGETMEEKQSGQTMNIIESGVRESVPENPQSEIIIAYEPRWAIGAGLTPSDTEIATAHTLIAKTLSEMGLGGTAILYGASVKGTNAASIMSIPNVDGVLVGGASLKSDDFIPIITSVK